MPAAAESTTTRSPNPVLAVFGRALEVTANDRRFLRSLRIAADEAAEEVN